MYINRWLSSHATFRPQKIAITCAESGRKLTYGQLQTESNKVAHSLNQQHIQPGDRVALLTHNDPRFFTLFFACAKLGAILVPLNWRLSQQEQQVVLQDCQAKILIVSKDLAPQAPAHDTTLTWEALEALPLQTSPLPAVDIVETTPVAIFYTGGTTGIPKGAILTHRSIFWNAQNTITGWGLSTDDIAPIFTPLFHTGGLNVFATPLLCLGATIVLTASFEPERALQLIEDESCTVLFLVPTMYHMLKESPGFNPDKLRRLKLMISGGAPCPKPLFDTYWSQGLPLRQGYGLTEAGPNTFGIEQKEAQKRVQTVGRPLPYVNLRLRKADGTMAEAGEVGELQIQGGHLMAGYWQRPDATSAVLDEEGWLSTGDLAYTDADGYYTICGRQKEMYISGGENVFPAEIEEVLLGHPHIAEVAVVGIADDRWGEVGRAHFVARDGAPANLSVSLKDFCRSRLAGFKIPKEFRSEPELPKSAAGKVLKTELAKR